MRKRKTSIYDQEYQELIDLLVEARKARDITQQQLSDKIGIERRNISKIETYNRRLDVVELDDWLRALNIKIDLMKEIKLAISS